MNFINKNYNLEFDINFDELYNIDGLKKIDQIFCNYLSKNLQNAFAKVNSSINLAATINQLSPKELDSFLIECSVYLEKFIRDLFKLPNHNAELEIEIFQKITKAKKDFIQRYVLKKYHNADSIVINEIINLLTSALQNDGFIKNNFITEYGLVKAVIAWQKNQESGDIFALEKLELAAQYSCWAIFNKEGQQTHKDWVLFNVPHKTNFEDLLKLNHQKLKLYENGFALRDKGIDNKMAFDQVNYCILCHNQNKDSCSKGLPEKNTLSENNPNTKFQKNYFGTLLTGCPLEEKISQAHTVKRKGMDIAALAIMMIDNPLLAATGHRICNDCMKACIYQKQDPVNIPGIESNILKNVLSLNWGFEIYSLLSRWNPINFSRPLAKESTGYNILIAGMGPAGFNLAYHLMQDGHNIVGIDGLKIEPLPPHFSGKNYDGSPAPLEPIINIQQIYENLDERVIGGFGGVCEYGITVRWDKNLLKVIRLLLERKRNFAVFGGIKMGSTITFDQAGEMGFDHIALCTGAGSPNMLGIENDLINGVRQASDFLMNLQLMGAFKKDSLANLQINLPAIVVGGGLTAVDSACEIIWYYRVQIEKIAKRYRALNKIYGDGFVEKYLNTQEKELLHTMLGNWVELEDNPKNYHNLFKKWGGVKILYRKDFKQSPSYTLNHEEVNKAIEEGIEIIDHAIPKKILTDQHQNACGLLVNINGCEKEMDAKTILVAAGTKPNLNVNINNEIKVFNNDGKTTFQPHDINLQPINVEKNPKPQDVCIFLNKNGVSFFGDLHPSFAGNVVKAMASAKRGFPLISKFLQLEKPKFNDTDFLKNIHEKFMATVQKINILSNNIIEVIVKAPMAAGSFQPGQFYKMQNFETFAKSVDGTKLLMEGTALTGAWVDKNQGLISLIILEMGTSSKLCRYLQKGEPITLMGPTGSPTEIPKNKNIILVGGGLGNAVLLAIGKSLRDNGCKVTYFAGYRNQHDIFKINELEESADQIIWCIENYSDFSPNRLQDLIFKGNVVDGMLWYTTLKTEKPFDLKYLENMIVIGSSRMMAAVAKARHNQLKKFLPEKYFAIGSINSPMQCMLKGVCAQCIQRQIDPVTGAEVMVYSCVNQDQNLDYVDFEFLEGRLRQNSLQEKISNLWLDYLLKKFKNLD